VSLPFLPSDAAMLALQAGVVAAPRIAPGTQRLQRLSGRGWALVPIRRGEKAPDLDLLRDMYGDTRIAHLRFAPALAGEVELCGA